MPRLFGQWEWAETLAERWIRINNRYLQTASRLGEVGGSFVSASKVLRLLMQSGILGLGAYLVIRQELSPGAMIASSLMMGRALAPIETAIANWRSFLDARQSIARLSEALTRAGPSRKMTALPKPTRRLDVERSRLCLPAVPSRS